MVFCITDFTKKEEDKAKSYVYESTQMLRELVLENVRAKEFPKHLQKRNGKAVLARHRKPSFARNSFCWQSRS